MFQWAVSSRLQGGPSGPLIFVVADYNPSVLQLVTLPNLVLCWAIAARQATPALADAFSDEDGELDLTPEVLAAFTAFLDGAGIRLVFLSGAWSPEFVQLVYDNSGAADQADARTLILGAETIYSPFALQSFTDTIFDILGRERTAGRQAAALVGAKRLYFGVGGSLDDFVAGVQEKGATVEYVSEETEGVRRGVVRCSLPA